MRGEEGIKGITKETIKVIDSEAYSIYTDPNPRPPTSQYSMIILIVKFLLTLNFGSSTLLKGCMTDRLGNSDEISAKFLR